MRKIVVFDKNLGINPVNRIDTRTFFDINAEPYAFTDDIDVTADFALAPTTRTDIKNLWLEVWHGYENQYKKIRKLLQVSNNIVVSNLIHPELDHDRHAFVDLLFNRTKAYYSQFPFRFGTKPWYYHGYESFVDCALVSVESKRKIFVSPSKTHNRSRIYRTQIVELLQDYKDIGYVANYDDQGTFLYPHIEFPYVSGIEELEQQTRPLCYKFWGYCPPHNAYYQNTFVSIYGETIEHGETHMVTEKTYDALIKGHFILPFSTSGFVGLLRKQGIRLPLFIDYSYDAIVDDQLRFRTYANEVRRLLDMPLSDWQQQYQNNFELLYQNKMWFQIKDYDRINLSELT